MTINKAQIKLREDNDMSAESAINDVAKQASQNPSKKASAPLSSFNNNDADNGPKITVDNDNPQSKQFVKSMANNPTMANSNATVEFTESKKAQPIVEGITFSKGELTAFLRSL